MMRAKYKDELGFVLVLIVLPLLVDLGDALGWF